MRWEQLLAADRRTEVDAADAEGAEFAGEVADRTRREQALIGLSDRLRAADSVTVGTAPAATVAGVVAAVGSDWLLLTDDRGEVLVPTAAILWVRGLPAQAEQDRSRVAARLDLGYALRAIARDRAAVLVRLADGTTLSGTIDRVGRDVFDLAEHAADEPRRGEAVRAVRTVVFAAVTSVRRA